MSLATFGCWVGLHGEYDGAAIRIVSSIPGLYIVEVPGGYLVCDESWFRSAFHQSGPTLTFIDYVGTVYPGYSSALRGSAYLESGYVFAPYRPERVDSRQISRQSWKPYDNGAKK